MLLIYTPEITARVEYIFEHIFRHQLGLAYTITNYKVKFESFTREKLNYSPAKLGDEFFISSAPLLTEKSISEKMVDTGSAGGMPVLFPQDGDLGFDVFAAVFYMISRYEEYLPHSPGRHGRFRAADSIAAKKGFLLKPVADHWIIALKDALLRKYPGLEFASKSFDAIQTYDIDTAYAWKGRNLVRRIGGSARDLLSLRWGDLAGRWSGGARDPWDMYASLKKQLLSSRVKNIFFFLVGGPSRYDKNIPAGHPLMTGLIHDTAAYTEVGIHPSYYSSRHKKIAAEKSLLESISGKKIRKSRQHYLRLDLPGTYSQLIAAGISEDHTMGYAETPGFRAGTCSPFYFYDLVKDMATALRIFPFACMDATFIHYQKKKPADAAKEIFSLLDDVKKCSGTFISIWHNNYLSGAGWREVHDQLIKKISE